MKKSIYAGLLFLGFFCIPSVSAENHALSFSNLTTGYMEIQNSGNLFGFVDSLTVEAWVNPHITYPYGPRAIIGKWNSYTSPGSNEESFIFRLWPAYNNSLETHISLSQYPKTPTTLKTYSDTSVPSDHWTHVAFTYDNNFIKIYTNGEQTAQSEFTELLMNPAPTTNLAIGAAPLSGYKYERFQGLIDEVRIWDYARTQQELMNNKNKILSGKEAGLIGYWNFDEGSGNQTFDQTPFARNGQMIYGDASWVKSDSPVTVTPEPVSSILFLLGSGAIGTKYILRKKVRLKHAPNLTA